MTIKNVKGRVAMSSNGRWIPKNSSAELLLPLPGDHGSRQLSTTAFLDGVRGGMLVAGGLLAIALIAFLDYWTGPHLSLSIFYLIPVAACAWWGGFPHGILLALGGAVAWQEVDALHDPSIPAIYLLWNGVVRFGSLVLTSSLVTRLHVGVLRERRLARTDALTGAANGRTFYEVAAAEAERGLRNGRPLTLAYLDLDHFKQLNDRLGHAVGDAALVHLVESMRPNLRGSDLLARLGGDEFALLLPETEGAGGLEMLQRLQQLIELAMACKDWPVTLSIGAITFDRPLLDVDQMIQRVDRLMYRAKQKGKNRLEHVILKAEDFLDLEELSVRKRSTARVLCNRSARLRREGEDDGDGEFATVRNISAGAIGLDLEKQFPPDTLLIVEPLAPDVKTLLARVLRVHPGGRGWMHECELSIRLNPEELHAWLGDHAQAVCS
jgi:diguanylate cyclase (GGDEF)-like protein